MFGIFKKKDPSNLLKKATKAKQSGDMDKAISLLRTAYKTISKGDIDYGIKTFLRLPLYMQKANRSEEAWKEFNNLLNKGYPNQLNDPQLLPMCHSEIYDKMRLFLQREGKNKEAVKYGIFSHLSWASGLFLQKRKKEFKDFISAETLEYVILKLLRKAKKQNLAKEILSIVKHEIKNIPNVDYKALGDKVDSFLYN